MVELFELQSQQGPCLDCYRTGRPVVTADLATANGRWPRFCAVAQSAGFRAADAIPMRLRGQVIGALNLFRTEPGSLNEDDLLVAQALADVSTIAILRHRKAVDSPVLNDQLNQALNSRIIIERAKGMIAKRQQIDMPAAFTRLRNHARNHNRRLADVANDIVQGALEVTDLR